LSDKPKQEYNKKFFIPPIYSRLMACTHEEIDKDWLPSDNKLIRKHPYCRCCGKVKNTSSLRAKRMGFFANILSKMRSDFERKGIKITQAQIRLILKELELKEAFDVFSLSFDVQKGLFIEVVAKYIGVSRRSLESYL
jgi:hypothetical protein